MSKAIEKLRAIPTNIITGFLGVGKTSAILHLLKSKPKHERWAVLVNEFGEIGVDGSLVQGQYNEAQQIYISEVPGGCMCCAAGLPMQVALNKLLTTAKPDRLLIEPTGLGHPVEVLETLSADVYRDVLSIQKTLTLVDARKLKDSRYTNHETFNQQIAIADVIVANKQDLYSPEHRALLKQYVESKASAEVEIIFTQQGRVAVDLLVGQTGLSLQDNSHSHHHHETNTGNELDEAPMSALGFIKVENEGEGFKSVGWRFKQTITFNKAMVFSFLSSINAERMKAVFMTEQGIFGYNLTSDGLTETELNDCLESRIEIIASDINEDWEGRLFSCML